MQQLTTVWNSSMKGAQMGCGYKNHMDEYKIVNYVR